MKFLNGFTYLILFLSIPISIPAQVLSENELNGGKIIKQSFFDGKSLWGYIDGGADLYMEYGFNNVVVQEFNLNGNKYKIEYYEMSSPESAFGIYSISHYNCMSIVEMGEAGCISDYQTLLIKDKFFVSIVNENGSVEEQKNNIYFAKMILKKIGEGSFKLPSFFSNKIFLRDLGELKFVSGTLGIQNGFPDWENLFMGIKKFRAYILRIMKNGEDINLSFMEFFSKKDLQLFFAQSNIPPTRNDNLSIVNNEDKNIIIKNISSLSFYYIESKLPKKDLEEYVRLLNKY